MKNLRIRVEQAHLDILDETIQESDGITTYQAAVCHAIVNLKKEKSAFAAKVSAMSKNIDILVELTAGGFSDSGVEDLPGAGSEGLIKQAKEIVERKISRAVTMKATRDRKWRSSF